MPFYFVQLSSLNRPGWQWFRDSQRRMQSELPNVAMAVSSDMGDSLNVHPTSKQPIGERLARIALHNLYDFGNVVPSGPAIKEASVVGDGIVRLTFDYADGLSTADGKHPATFEIAEEEGLYKPAEARIEGNTVVVMAADVAHPRFVLRMAAVHTRQPRERREAAGVYVPRRNQITFSSGGESLRSCKQC